MEAPKSVFIHPVYRLTGLCVAGLFAGLQFAPHSPLLPDSLGLLAFAFAVGAWFVNHIDKTSRCASILCTFALLLFCIWRGAVPVATHDRNEQWMAHHLVPLQGEMTLNGTVLKAGWTQSGRSWVQMRGGSVSMAGGETRYPGEMRIYGMEKSFGSPGDRLTLDISSVRQPVQSYPGGFDPASWRVREGFHATATLIRPLSRTNEPGFGFRWVREQADSIRRLLRTIPMEKESKGVLIAILSGDKSGLTPESEVQMRRAGLSHLLAVSGLHVGMVTAPFWWLFIRLRNRWFAVPYWLLFGVLLLLYAEVAQQSPSVVRAVWMTWLGGCLWIPMRRWPTSRLLLLVGMGALFWKPVWLLHPGFQLSVTAVWAIVSIHTPMSEWIRDRMKSRWVATFLTTCTLTLTVQLALLPLLVWWFGEFSVIAPISNLLIAPFIPVVTLSGWVLGVWSGLTTHPGMLLWGVGLLMEWIQTVARIASALPGATVQPNWSFTGLLLPPLVSVLLHGSSWITSSRHRTRVWVQISILLLLLSVLHLKNRNQLLVTVLDVGQGDAIHIRLPGGRHLWIDTGTDRTMDWMVLPYLEDHGIQHIDTLVLTHAHKDHMGGLDQLFSEVEVGRVLLPSRKKGEVRVGEGLTSGRVFEPPPLGRWLEPDPRVRLYLLWTDPSHDSVNDRSIVVKLQFGKTSMLFPGDIERGQELSLARNYGTWLKSDLLKAGHHGSRTSSYPFFLEKVDPERVVISSGWMNRYDHPHRETIRRFGTRGATIRVTARSGTIRMRSDGVQIREIVWNRLPV